MRLPRLPAEWLLVAAGLCVLAALIAFLVRRP
jgi:hypothetical protein